MRGYVLRDRPDYLWVQDKLSIWMVEAEDVLEREDWDGVDDPRFTGEPQIVHIRDGAEIQEVRPVTLVGQERPMALGKVEHVLQVLGLEVLEELSRNKVVALEVMGSDDMKTLAGDAGAPAPRPTYSMKEDHSGWGIVSHKDD
ncbi:MAG TPA: hypothetical protein VGW10_13740 [Solirubrobacteraceae bacterium]|nr:hypothetical protein [Solirubrobacteraceae bacterium]